MFLQWQWSENRTKREHALEAVHIGRKQGIEQHPNNKINKQRTLYCRIRLKMDAFYRIGSNEYAIFGVSMCTWGMNQHGSVVLSPGHSRWQMSHLPFKHVKLLFCPGLSLYICMFVRSPLFHHTSSNAYRCIAQQQIRHSRHRHNEQCRTANKNSSNRKKNKQKVRVITTCSIN